MKTRIISVLAILMCAVVLLASCGGVPDEKLTKVGDLYSELGNDYSKLVQICSDNGYLDDTDFAQSISDYGTAISDYGTEISNSLDGMKEEEVDSLITDLEEMIAQIEEIYATCESDTQAAG